MKKKVVNFLLTIITIAAVLPTANAQECNMLAPGSDAGFDQLGFCAPVTGRVKYFTFYALNEIPTSKLKVEINWGEGKKRYNVTSLGYDSNLKMWAYQMPEATHVYEKNRSNPKCSYPVTVQAVVDGKLCGAPKQSGTVIVWDTDNTTGGSLLLDPTTYYACPGTEFSVNFTDESSWNCVPPKEKVNINWPKRTTQFVYGSANTITGQVKVEGVNTTFPFEGAFLEYEDKAQGPGGAYSQSAKITIPATAKVGEKFEITLNNWNYCNQQPNAPIQKKAIIEIVAKPKPTITVKDKSENEADAFCPGEEVKLYGGYFTEAGTVLATDVQYNWTIENLQTGKTEKFDNQKDVVLKTGFDQPGVQKIVLKVTNKKTNTVACENVLEKTISIIDAPVVNTTINGTAIKELFFCAEDLKKVYHEIEFQHTFTSNEDFSYSYHLFKRNSTKTNPDSTLNLITGTGEKSVQKLDIYKATYTKPGLYRIQILAKNNSTGCVTVDENQVAIYEKPIPDFTVTGFCAGQPTVFTDKSSVSTSVPGDKIHTRFWDLNYTAENIANNTFDNDGTGKTFNWTFAQPGTYNVALKVSSKAGCDTIKTIKIEIKAVPEAKLSSDYSGELICPGDTVKFENTSLAIKDASQFPTGVTYTLFISDSVVTKEIVLKEDQKFVDYSSFYNPSDSVETYTAWLQATGNDPNNCTVSSDPILVKVRSGAAAGYVTTPVYSPFEPNCSPKTWQFATNKATRELKADSYKWTIIFNGEVKDEIVKERGTSTSFETLDYTFGNNSLKYLDYEVKLTVEKAGICVIPSINTFRIYPNPRPLFTAVPALEACDSTVFELKVLEPAGISDYIWEFSPEHPANNKATGVKDDNFYIAYNRPEFGASPRTYTIKLKAKNFYGCEAAWTEEITINPVVMHDPVLSLTSIEGNGCRPLKANFVNQTVGDLSKSSFRFFVEDVATGILSEIDLVNIKGDINTEFSYTFLESGNFKTYLQGKAELADGACTRPLSKPVAISVNKDPVANFTVYPTEDCGSLTAVIAKTNPDSEYNTWTITDNETGEIIYGPSRTKSSEDIFNQYEFINTTNRTKTYNIKLTAENTAGCVASDSMSVSVFAQPKAHFTATTDACDPHVVTVAHHIADNPADISYTWIWGDGTTSEGIDPPAHSYRNDSYTRELHYNIKLVAKSANGCTSDSTIRVIIHPRVKADFDANVFTGCAPLNVNFTNKSKGAIESMSGWYIKEKGAQNFTFVNHNLLQYTFENTNTIPKQYEVMYKAQNAGVCADSIVKEITVQPEVLADFSVAPSREVYSGTSIKFTNQKLIPGITYTWNWGDGSAPQESNKAAISHSYINRSTNNHYYEVTLTADDPVNGCRKTHSIIITVYPQLQLSLSAKKDTVCIPEVPDFNLLAQNVKDHYWYTGKKGNVNYSKKLNDIYDPALFKNETGAPIIYEVVYVGVTVEGFKDSIKSEVIVYPALKPSFSLDGLSKQLPNASFSISNTTANASAWATHWDFGNGDTSNKANPGTYQYPTFGSYNITLTISNGFCTESFSMRVNVLDAMPDISFKINQAEGCGPVTVKFENTSSFTDENNYLWDFGDGMGTSTAINPSYTYNKPGNYKVTLNAYNRTGKENAVYTSEQVIKVYPQPSPDFVVRKELVYIPDEPVYVANYSQRGVWYRWDFGDGTVYEGADQFEPVHYYKKPGQYNIKLVVRSEFGCEDSITVLRAVTAEGGGNVTIPNAFTPNPNGSNGGYVGQGGINDIFHPVFKGTVLKYQMLIYNRWGELVFETTDIKKGWDGYYKGRLCNSGMYLYKLSATLSDQKNINEMGDLMLIQ